jgi:protein transport protein SEC31
MKLRKIDQAATFCWSPTQTPLLATGTVAGALDASFSTQSELQIWNPDLGDETHEGKATKLGSAVASARYFTQ